MGIFTSKCPTCDAGIDWFLEPPVDYVCKCGAHVPPDVIRASWNTIYTDHLKGLIREMRDDGSDLAELLSKFSRQLVEEVLAESR